LSRKKEEWTVAMEYSYLGLMMGANVVFTIIGTSKELLMCSWVDCGGYSSSQEVKEERRKKAAEGEERSEGKGRAYC
jgi:hypothetical protein